MDRVLFEYSPQVLLVFGAELFLGKLNVERDVEHAEEIVIIIVGHPFALLADPCSRPSHFVANQMHFVPVQVLHIDLET